MTQTSGSNSNTEAGDFASIDISPQREGQKVSDELMQEIADRLQVTVPTTSIEGADVIKSVSPPNDQSALWQPVDVAGNPTDGIHYYNPVTGEWVLSSSTSDQYFESKFIDCSTAGVKTVSLSGFTNIPDEVFTTVTAESTKNDFDDGVNNHASLAALPAGTSPTFWLYKLSSTSLSIFVQEGSPFGLRVTAVRFSA